MCWFWWKWMAYAQSSKVDLCKGTWLILQRERVPECSCSWQMQQKGIFLMCSHTVALQWLPKEQRTHCCCYGGGQRKGLWYFKLEGLPVLAYRYGRTVICGAYEIPPGFLYRQVNCRPFRIWSKKSTLQLKMKTHPPPMQHTLDRSLCVFNNTRDGLSHSLKSAAKTTFSQLLYDNTGCLQESNDE